MSLTSSGSAEFPCSPIEKEIRNSYLETILSGTFPKGQQ